jgi:hypothetical protein
MDAAEDAEKSPGSRAIAVIARDRKTKSHRGGTEARRGQLPRSPEIAKKSKLEKQKL